MRLFRPVDLEELRLIYDSGMQAFPPPRAGQPTFCPVVTESYATKIAREWTSGLVARKGLVTCFEVDDPYVEQFERHFLGSPENEEIWVPGEEILMFNRNIRGTIHVVGAYFGRTYEGHVPAQHGLKGKTAHRQFLFLAGALPYSSSEVATEISNNHVAVFLNFLYWEQADFSADGINTQARDRILAQLWLLWAQSTRAAVPLGVEAGG